MHDHVCRRFGEIINKKNMVKMEEYKENIGALMDMH